MSKNTLTIRVPEELKDRIETLAAQQGVSINQLAMYAFTKEIGELETRRCSGLGSHGHHDGRVRITTACSGRRCAPPLMLSDGADAARRPILL